MFFAVDPDTLDRLFKEISSGGVQQLDKAAFQHLMVSNGFALYQQPELVHSFFNALDDDENGFIDKHELYVITYIVLSLSLLFLLMC